MELVSSLVGKHDNQKIDDNLSNRAKHGTKIIIMTTRKLVTHAAEAPEVMSVTINQSRTQQLFMQSTCGNTSNQSRTQQLFMQSTCGNTSNQSRTQQLFMQST
jgi:hypothetical protein